MIILIYLELISRGRSNVGRLVNDVLEKLWIGFSRLRNAFGGAFHVLIPKRLLRRRNVFSRYKCITVCYE